MCVFVSPVFDMIDQMLFKHPAPLLDGVHEGDFKWFDVNLTPATEHPLLLQRLYRLIQTLELTDLYNTHMYTHTMELL